VGKRNIAKYVALLLVVLLWLEKKSRKKKSLKKKIKENYITVKLCFCFFGSSVVRQVGRLIELK